MSIQKSSISPGKKLTEKEQRFIKEYLIDLNATQAAIRAKYSLKSAADIGYQILQKEHVQVAIQEIRPQTIELQSIKYKENQENRLGSIYLIQCKGFNYYKIGRATHVDTRIRALQCGIPFELELIKMIDVQEVPDVKSHLLIKYQSNLIRGEWYKFSPTELQDVICYLDSLVDQAS